jgi:cathepsin A (carboxypeptidase C)
MFYWWFESRSDPAKDPIVLWLTGGPGCASEIALFYENGPYKFNSDNKTLYGNAYSWNDKANVVYVDQPVPTGYSKAAVKDVVTNEKEVAENMGSFFIHFLEKYPQL